MRWWNVFLSSAALALLSSACAPASTDETQVQRAEAALTTAPAVLGSDATGFVRAAVTGNVGLVVWQTAAGVSAQRVDTTGAPLGPVIPLGAWSGSVSVAGGNGVFAVITGGSALSVRRIDQNGALIDAGWVPVSVTYPALQDARSTAIAFDGAQFVAEYVHAHPDPNYNNDELSRVLIPTTGPITPSAGTTISGGASSYIDETLFGLACAGSVCGRVYSLVCGGPSCLLPASQQGTLFRVGAATTQISAVGAPSAAASIAANGAGFLVTKSACQDVVALRFDTSGAAVGGPSQVAPPPGSSEHTATFDGADFAVAWKSAGGGAVDVFANWVSPAGVVAFPSSDPAVASTSTDDHASLASFGGGSSLLAARSGADVTARILTKGIGPSPQGVSGPPSTFPDGQFGTTSAHGFASLNGSGMALNADTTGKLVSASVDAQLHVTGRDAGVTSAPYIGVAASNNGYLAVLNDGTGLSVRRFQADGTPSDPAWSPLPYLSVSGATPAPVFDGTSYQLYFGGSTPVCNGAAHTYQMAIPATGPLGALGATQLQGTSSIEAASCYGSACVAVGYFTSSQLELFRPAGKLYYSPGIGSLARPAVAMGPSDGLLVMGAGNGTVYGQRLDATGAPTGPVMTLGGNLQSFTTIPHIAVAWDGQRYIVAWVTNGGSTDIDVNWVTQNGPLYPTGQILVDEPKSAYAPHLAQAANGTAFLSYAVKVQVGAQGKVKIVDPSGIVVCNDTLTVGPPHAVGASPQGTNYVDVEPTGTGALLAWKEPDANGTFLFVRAGRVDMAGLPLDVPPIDLGSQGTGPTAIAYSGQGAAVFLGGNNPKTLSVRKLTTAAQPAGPWVSLKPLSQGPLTIFASYDGVDYVVSYAEGSDGHLLRVDPSTLAIVSDTVIVAQGNILDLACDPPDCYVYYNSWAQNFPQYLATEQGTSVLVTPVPDGFGSERLVTQPSGPMVVIEGNGTIHGEAFSPGLTLLQNSVFQFGVAPNTFFAGASYDGLSVVTSFSVSSSDTYVRSSLPGSCNHVVQQSSAAGRMYPYGPGKTLLVYTDSQLGMATRIIDQAPACQSAADCPSGFCVAGACCAQSCDDGETCTADTCAAGGQTCVHTPVADGTLCSGGTCLSGACAQSTNTGGAGGGTTTGTGGAGGGTTITGGSGGGTTTSTTSTTSTTTTSTTSTTSTTTTSTTSTTTTSTTSTSTGTGGSGGGTTTSETGGAGGTTTSTTTTSETGGAGGTTTTTTSTTGAGGATTTSETGGVGGGTTTSTGVAGSAGTETAGGSAPDLGVRACACRAAGETPSSPPAEALFLAGLLVAGARRRRRQSAW